MTASAIANALAFARARQTSPALPKPLGCIRLAIPFQAWSKPQ
jgi:hypothetical protein